MNASQGTDWFDHRSWTLNSGASTDSPFKLDRALNFNYDYIFEVRRIWPESKWWLSGPLFQSKLLKLILIFLLHVQFQSNPFPFTQVIHPEITKQVLVSCPFVNTYFYLAQVTTPKINPSPFVVWHIVTKLIWDPSLLFMLLFKV